MKAFFLLLSVFFNTALTKSHDIPLTFLTLSMMGDDVHLEIKLEIEDLEIVLGQKALTLDDSLIEEYILNTVFLSFDGKEALIGIYDFRIKKEHLLVKANVEAGDFCQSIDVSTSFLNEIPNHSNIFQLKMGEIERDFRLHKARKHINIELE